MTLQGKGRKEVEKEGKETSRARGKKGREEVEMEKCREEREV